MCCFEGDEKCHIKNNQQKEKSNMSFFHMNHILIIIVYQYHNDNAVKLQHNLENISHTKKKKRFMKMEKETKNEQIKEMGSLQLRNIRLFTIIGEIEGHEAVSGNTKATKYEHILPQLAEIELNDEIEGALFLLNTLGGDVDAGLAIAEMIASLSKPTVSLVLGGSHSIGGPLAVATDYSFIVPTGTMVVHPVRSSGLFIGVKQSYLNMVRTQDRITGFLAKHSNITKEKVEELMLNPTELVKDVGTLLEGEEAVKVGLINEVGGIKNALEKLYQMIDKKNK